MTVSDWIQFWGIIAATIVGVVSAVLSVIAIRQNSKMIRESTRPYLTMYFESVSNGLTKSFIVLKNFGQTGAYITRFRYDDQLKSIAMRTDWSHTQFEHIEGIFLAPGQAKRFQFDPINYPDTPLTFELGYSAGNERYFDTCVVHVEHESKYFISRNVSKDKELRIIADSLQEISERLL